MSRAYAPLYLLLIALVVGCNQADIDLSAHYFPLDALEEGRVYLYKSQSENLPVRHYWFYQSTRDDRGKPHLKAISLDREGLPLQFLEYSVDTGEVRLVSQFIVERDKRGHSAVMPVKIEQPYVYNLALEDTTKAMYAKMIWFNPFDSLEYTLEKVRSFDGAKQIDVLGENHSAIAYRIATEFFTFTPRDGETDSAWPEYEIYAEGLGLVEYKMAPDPDFPIQMKLSKIYSKEEYQRLYSIHLDSLRPDLTGIQRR